MYLANSIGRSSATMRTLWPLVLVSVTVLFIHINVACALQNITVDNTDHTMISYSGIWDETVQNSLDYNNSHSLSRELSATATFIFTGVAVYYMSPLWPYSVTTQLTLDGSTRVTLDLSGPGTDVNGEETVRSAVVWGVSELMDMQHTLVVSMAPNGMWIEVDAFIYTISTAPQQSPTTLASASNQQNPPTVTSISRPNGSVFEPVVGGVFGGIAIIIVLAIALCCWQGRRRNQHQTVDLEEEVNVSVASPGGNTESFPQRQPILPNILPSSSELASSHISAAQSPYPANLAPLTPTPLEFPVLSSAPQVSSIEDAISLQEHSIQLQHFVERNASAIIPAANLVSTAQFAGTPSSSVSAPLVSLSQTQQLSERSPDISGPASGVIPIVDTSEITTSLTADQAQFINRLYILNVPADEIARVMEAMRLERAEGAGECPSSGPSRIQSLWSQEAPPSYSIMDIQLTTS